MQVTPADPTQAPAIWSAPTPPGWRQIGRAMDGAKWRLPGGAVVIASMARLQGERWVHLSMSRHGRLPTWPELVAVRDALVPGVECYQVAPPPDRYVNIHPGVLHPWGCVDRPDGVLPNLAGQLADGSWTI